MVPFCIALYLLVLTMKTAQSVFFFFNLSPFVGGALAHQFGQKTLQRDYVKGAVRDLDQSVWAIIQQHAIETPFYKNKNLHTCNGFYIRDRPELSHFKDLTTETDKGVHADMNNRGPESWDGIYTLVPPLDKGESNLYPYNIHSLFV